MDTSTNKLLGTSLSEHEIVRKSMNARVSMGVIAEDADVPGLCTISWLLEALVRACVWLRLHKGMRISEGV